MISDPDANWTPPADDSELETGKLHMMKKSLFLETARQGMGGSAGG
jgi:hypothetical protein